MGRNHRCPHVKKIGRWPVCRYISQTDRLHAPFVAAAMIRNGLSANRKLGLSSGTGPRRTADLLTTLSVLIRISIGEQKANIA